ncbi:MAG: hypothetical protein ACI8Q1_002972 [Parvicella sp.]|jgi:hypothetical protein
MKTGDIYRFSNEHATCVVRIFVFDDDIVYLDHWSESSKSWLKIGHSTIVFSSIYTISMKKHAKLIDRLDFTDVELSKIRPDLPVKLGVNKKLDWKLSKGEFDKALIKLGYKDHVFKINKICFFTIGRKDGFNKKPHYLTSDGEDLSLYEILIFAYNTHNEFGKALFEGIGIYRIGYNNKVPSFYIGGGKSFVDLGIENLKERGYLME